MLRILVFSSLFLSGMVETPRLQGEGLFSQGAGANIWNALVYALIGGLLSSTLFVLTTTPAFYYLFGGGWRRL